MKKILLFIFCIPLFGISQTDTTYNVNGKISNVNQKGINHLIEKYKKILKNTGGVEGWRIQLKFKAKREDILPYQIKFTNLYPKIPSQISFESPYYKLTVGNFRTKNEALKIQHLISKKFPGAHPIPIIIEPKLLKN